MSGGDMAGGGPMPQRRAGDDSRMHNLNLIDMAFRLGVPTFLLIVGMLLLLPRLDNLLIVGNRVEAYLNLVAQYCMPGVR